MNIFEDSSALTFTRAQRSGTLIIIESQTGVADRRIRDPPLPCPPPHPPKGTSPPSLSALSSHSVSMTTLQPTPLQPAWHTQCRPLCSRVQRPCPLHSPGQPSGGGGGGEGG